MTERRAALPGAAELFRSTRERDEAQPGPERQPEAGRQAGPERQPEAGRRTGPERQAEQRTGTGRERHTAKITVYLSDEELVALEQARLALRAEHRLPVDRGRIVREAVAVLLEDFERDGAESLLVRRLGREHES